MVSNPGAMEVLVHVTAASTAADDDTYRELARAYLDFVPAVRTDVLAAPVNGAANSISSQLREPALIASPFLSFGDAMDNLRSPDVRAGRAPVQEASASQSSWQEPPGVVSDSVPENDVSLQTFCSPTRIMEHFLHGRSTHSMSPLAKRKVPSPLPPDDTLTSLTPRKGGEDLVHLLMPLDEVTASLLPSSPTRGGPDAGDFDTLAKRTARAGSAPPLAKRPRLSGPEEPAASLARSSSDIGPPQERTRLERLRILEDRRQELDMLLEIHSPEPPVSCEDLDASALILPRLKRLATQLNMEQRFRSARQHRELRPFERGYWLVDCTSWNASVREMAWDMLANYISNGFAGWGIWCRRDVDYSTIRLYCWGYVARHMHLLLYLASQRQIKFSRSSWIGGDGAAVIEMPAWGVSGTSA